MHTFIDFNLAQQIVHTVKDVCGCNINFIDCSGIIFASTDEKRIGTFHEIGRQAAVERRTIEVDTDNDFAGTQRGVNLPIFHNHEVTAVIGISGPPAEAAKYAHLAERITKLLIREKELYSFSRTQEEMRHYLIHSFIGRETPDRQYMKDICARWKINIDAPGRLILLRLNCGVSAGDIAAMEQEIENMLKSAEIPLYTYHYPNEYLAVAQDEVFARNRYLLEAFARKNRQLLKIAVGRSAVLSGLSDSYESALTAMKSIASGQEAYVLFDTLTLEILLCNLEVSSRKEYLKKTTAGLTNDDLNLITVYFNEDMSLSRTCQKLYLHKNTLQYRLKRIHKITGYDPRKFRDAVLLYLAVMIQ